MYSMIIEGDGKWINEMYPIARYLFVCKPLGFSIPTRKQLFLIVTSFISGGREKFIKMKIANNESTLKKRNIFHLFS